MPLCAGEREALLLAAGQLAGRPVAEIGEADEPQQLVDAGGPRGAGVAGGCKRIAQVAGGAAPEQHADITLEKPVELGKLRAMVRLLAQRGASAVPSSRRSG